MATPVRMRLPLRQSIRQIPSQRTCQRCLHHFQPRPCFRTRPTSCPWTLQQRRHGSFWVNARRVFRQHPLQISLGLSTVLFGIFSLGVVNYYYQKYIIAAYHNYPEEVAKPLRKAVWYTTQDLQPKEAIKYYKQAIETADEIQMDPMSDELMGIKLRVAELMEKIHQYYRVVEVLERIRADNLEWLRRFGDLPHNRKRRTHVLKKTIQITVKLSEVYASPGVWDRETAQEKLVWAVETCLKEKRRRAAEGVREEDEGPFFSDSEFGASLESLAHMYEQKDQHYLSTPLFLQALRFYPTSDCHAVVLMSNLASSLAQQSPHAAAAAQAYADSMSITERPVGPAATREMLVENARTWAQKALDAAANIKPPERTPECDEGCVAALHNLGEFAEMSQQVDEAQRKYREALSLARAIGFEEGIEQSSARLRALQGISG